MCVSIVSQTEFFHRRDIVKDVDVILMHVIRLLTIAKSFLLILYTFYNLKNI